MARIPVTWYPGPGTWHPYSIPTFRTCLVSLRPNCRRLLAEWERLQAQGESLRAQLEEARKRIAALEAEVRRGWRPSASFSRDEPIPGRRPG
jgi:hypothetical protein